MNQQEVAEKILPLILWYIAVVCFVILRSWKKKRPTVGLPFAYIVDLTLIHLFGAMVYAVPTYYPESQTIRGIYTPEHVYLGFRQTVIGITAFVFGSAFLTPVFFRALRMKGPRNVPYQPNHSLPKVYLITALIFNVILGVVIGKIPSVGTMVGSGRMLIITSLCLMCWIALQRRKKSHVYMILIIGTVLFPLMSLLNGFLGFGIRAASILYVFLFIFYKPRWHMLLAGVLAVFLGLSFYLSYMEQRSELRYAAWQGEGSTLSSVVDMFEKFEFIDLKNNYHLTHIDGRLNQNSLVGAAVQHVGSREQDFLYGETIWLAVIAMVPRILWPDKPVIAGGNTWATHFTGIPFAEGTSVGVGQVMEFYVNFGTVGVIVGFLCLGVLLTIFDIKAALHLRSDKWTGFVFWFVPGLGFLQSIDSLMTIVASVASALVFCLLINKYILPRFSEKRAYSKEELLHR